MNVSKIPYVSQLSKLDFESVLPAPLNKKLTGSKVFKEATALDVSCLKSYVSAKPFRVGFTPEEIKEVSKFDGEEFLVGAYELITRKLGLGENVRPALYFVDTPQNYAMMYTNFTNSICVNMKSVLDAPKPVVFALLRHEVQHYLQTVNILRHEKLGPKAVEFNVQKFKELEIENVKNCALNCTDEQLAEVFSPEVVEYVKTARALLLSEDKKGFAELVDSQVKAYRQQLETLRNRFLTHFGVIKGDSKLTPKIESDFEEFKTIGYFNPDGTLDLQKYFDTEVEKEAIKSQVAAQLEFERPPCPFASIKKDVYDVYAGESATYKDAGELRQFFKDKYTE